MSKNQIELKKLKKHTITTFIDQIILVKLRNNPMSGYALSNYITEKFGISISPGIIYSHLYKFEREEIVCAVQTDTKRIYKLTKMGTQYLEILCDLCKKTVNILKQEFEKEKR
jgi:DNA-binding PadR family transcriptional regulator